MLDRPLALIAEITHRCPLHCVYCSNPLRLAGVSAELSTEDWQRVLVEAAELGVLHVHFTGGEPLARADLTDLVGAAHTAGLYVNLITSGIGLGRESWRQLVSAGVDHLQLSLQDSREQGALEISGSRSFQRKIEVAGWIREYPVAFTINIVVHRQNLDHLEEIFHFAERLEPDRIEIAHAQYYGWALENRSALMPTRKQVDRATEIVLATQQRLKGRIRIDSVLPDYYARYPKACMGGWGHHLMLINPSGIALPCHSAEVVSDLKFENVRDHSLSHIWEKSPSFQKFRGEDWMPELCRNCDRRGLDFGGCRCQALLLTGNAAATDPACSLSPKHHIIERILQETGESPAAPSSGPPGGWKYRSNPTQSAELASGIK